MGKKVKTLKIFMGLVLLASLATIWIPFISLQLPAIGEISWSVQDLVKMIPKDIFKASSNRRENVPEIDFMGLLRRLTVGSKAPQKPLPLSVEFIAGVLIPVALAIAYLMVILGLIGLALGRKGFLTLTSAIAACASLYVIFGIQVLSWAAQKRMDQALSRLQAHPFSFVTKYFVEKTAVSPDQGIFLLAGLATTAFLVAFFAPARTLR